MTGVTAVTIVVVSAPYVPREAAMAAPLNMPRPNRATIEATRRREHARFAAERPKSAALWQRGKGALVAGVPMAWMTTPTELPPVFVAEGRGAHFIDVDGHRYLDMNVADMSGNAGYATPAIVEAVSARVRKGTQFLLPTEDAIAVAEELARRFGLPFWQFTLSASGANGELIRLARHATGRQKILMFDGGYQGHLDDTLVVRIDGAVRHEMSGLPERAIRNTKLVDFNDLAAVEAALAPRDVACVFVEPALTNVGVVMPAPGFLAGLRELTHAVGTYLFLDETHTLVSAPGGLIQAWGLACDGVGMGKTIGGGVPLGAWGVTAELAERMLDVRPVPGAPGQAGQGVATGGTLYGNALSMAAARATLENVLVPAAYEKAARLGARLADGLEAIYAEVGLPWRAHRLYARSGWTFGPDLPRNATEARALMDAELFGLIQVYLANRGVWEAIASAGPCVSFAAEEADVALYLDVMRGFVQELVA